MSWKTGIRPPRLRIFRRRRRRTYLGAYAREQHAIFLDYLGMNPGAVLHELTHAVVRHYADDVKPHGRTFVCTQAELWRAAGLDDESE